MGARGQEPTINLASLIETEFLRAAETEAGRKQMRERLRGILQEELARADVFANAKVDTLWKLNRSSLHPCPQRSQLVNACVEALLTYARSHAQLTLCYPELQRDVEQAVKLIGAVLGAFYPRNKKLYGYYAEISRRVQAITPDDYAKLNWNKKLYRQAAIGELSHSLCVVFRAHLGIEPYYPDDALFRAVASILQILEIETGGLSTVADRVRKRHELRNARAMG